MAIEKIVVPFRDLLMASHQFISGIHIFCNNTERFHVTIWIFSWLWTEKGSGMTAKCEAKSKFPLHTYNKLLTKKFLKQNPLMELSCAITSMCEYRNRKTMATILCNTYR